ncbi:hypothetical protein FNV43_RR22331 [Rhamnella rubrinervis]|uniref:Uncharacterized protein n=1 Tax=Rhamnella rubrinervis TaxID=2594499 RepID=A0A8K0DWC8_9ROSA|nr:hypothetical protein FNV43_RR22331 [Rhamnella rubrinervis]
MEASCYRKLALADWHTTASFIEQLGQEIWSGSASSRSETSATTIEWAMSELLRNPKEDVQSTGMLILSSKRDSMAPPLILKELNSCEFPHLGVGVEYVGANDHLVQQMTTCIFSIALPF